MKKILAALSVPGLVLGGAAMAGAQTTPDTSISSLTDADGTESVDTVGHVHRGRHGGWGRIAEALDLTREALRDAIEEGKTIADIAAEQGVDIDTVIDDLVAEAQTRADENPDSRFAEKFDATEMEQRLTDFVNGEIDLSEPMGRRGHGRRVSHVGGNIAEALGLEGSELREALSDGSTIADVASAQGVDIDGVIDQLVADAEARVAENPDSRFAEKFDATEMEERLTSLVNGEVDLSERGRRGHRGGHGGFTGGPRGASIDSIDSGANA